MSAPVKVFTHKGYTCGVFKEGSQFRTVCQKAGKFYTMGKWSNLGAALLQSTQALEMAYPNPKQGATITNPIWHSRRGWYFGSKGPFPTRAKALEVMRAMFWSGYRR